LTVLEYLDRGGSSSFAQWFRSLNAPVAAKVTVGLQQLAAGNLSNVNDVGAGVFEYCINFSPECRFYFGKDGDAVAILLGGGAEKPQDEDIAVAHDQWADYKRRKAEDA
jgi:putative addiction module killer protein